MKKLAALITAFVLMLSFCTVSVSAAKYGKNPEQSEAAANGDYVYYFSDNKICRLHITDRKQKTVCGVIGENPRCICVMGNYLYYTSKYEYEDEYEYNVYDAVYKVDIKSGKQTKILDCKDKSDETYISSIITSGNRLYISFDIFVHEEVNDMYYVGIYDTNGKRLGSNFTPCCETINFFIDASYCEVCAAAKVKKIVYLYDEDGNVDDWYAVYTDAYNIVKLSSDFSEEKNNCSRKNRRKCERISLLRQKVRILHRHERQALQI